MGSRYWTQTVGHFPMEDYPCNNSRNRALEKRFQVEHTLQFVLDTYNI